MKIILILFFILICIIVLFKNYYYEKFTVDFIPYQNPYFGYCSAGVSEKEFATGNYDTYCWDNYAYEDCELLNTHGYNCGRNLKTGELLKCVHNEGTCKKDSQCHSSCFDQVGPYNEPYMIKVESNNLIGLGATQ